MNYIEFKDIRASLGKTQKQMAQLLGTSIKAIHSYEQGWRTIPHHVERQILFILARLKLKDYSPTEKCWEINACPDDLRHKCPAWEFNSGDLCWFINGTICNGQVHGNWQKKIAMCKNCNVFNQLFNNHKTE